MTPPREPASPVVSGIDQFLQPQSMVTPGLLGTVAMFGTNTLCAAFPLLAPVHVALGLSFFFGIVTIVRTTAVVEKAVYYVVNSLIILSMAFGTNSIGRQTAQRVADIASPVSFASFHIIAPAYAQSKEASNLQEFFRPWGATPRPPASPTQAAPQPPNKAAPADVQPYRIVSLITGDCTTIYLPGGNANGATAVRASIAGEDTEVLPGACSTDQARPPDGSGFIFLGNRRADGREVNTSFLLDGGGKPVSLDDARAGETYRLSGNLVLREGEPANDSVYFRGQKSLGVLAQGTTVQLISPPVDIVRTPSLTQTWGRVKTVR